MRKIKILFLSLLLLLMVPVFAFASSDSMNDTSKTQKVRLSDLVINEVDELHDHAAEHNIPLEFDGKKLYKIEYEYIEEKQEKEEINNNINSYRVTVTDYGHGFYNSSDDLLHRFVVDGPDTFKISKTEGHTTEFGSNFGASWSVIEAGVSFKYNTNYSITMTSNTPVSSSQKLVVNIYKTFLKKKYNVYKDPLFGSEYLAGSSFAYKPTGTYIQKTFYKK
ncbi:hypothetical protein ACFVAD_16755 [Sutcliffiella sp. NPDC057660]|uniref:hypothetical protein n=1 Tax=Sutcliffiella sp. NPDC057660 TaxID=3346199 RepID=UPI0036A24369